MLGRIRAVVFDVDGVLTDGGFWWGEDGEELKRFSFSDVMGISLARKDGLVVGLISGEDSPLVDRFANKMGITNFVKGCKDKARALGAMAGELGFSLSDVCYMGDDVNDLGAMQIAGLGAAPANARPEILAVARFIATANGGNGAVRELLDAIVLARRAGNVDLA